MGGIFTTEVYPSSLAPIPSYRDPFFRYLSLGYLGMTGHWSAQVWQGWGGASESRLGDEEEEVKFTRNTTQVNSAHSSKSAW